MDDWRKSLDYVCSRLPAGAASAFRAAAVAAEAVHEADEPSEVRAALDRREAAVGEAALALTGGKPTRPAAGYTVGDYFLRYGVEDYDDILGETTTLLYRLELAGRIQHHPGLRGDTQRLWEAILAEVCEATGLDGSVPWLGDEAA